MHKAGLLIILPAIDHTYPLLRGFWTPFYANAFNNPVGLLAIDLDLEPSKIKLVDIWKHRDWLYIFISPLKAIGSSIHLGVEMATTDCSLEGGEDGAIVSE